MPSPSPGFAWQGVRVGAPRWLADLQGLARQRLSQAGVTRISSAQRCTVEECSDFFSYRRDGVTGRMAAAVWLRG
jgi:copper oxidase (laccase) domain-containing protein